MQHKATVIILCRNEETHLATVLDNMLAQDIPVKQLEILAIDGLSTDATPSIILKYAKKHPHIKYLINPEKTVPYALNLGIKQATGDLILPINAHSSYPPNYISKLAAYLDSLKADNVGGAWETRPGKKGPEALSVALACTSVFGMGNAMYRIGSPKIIQTDTVPFGCYRRKLFERIGMFDTELTRNQDDEFNARLVRNGGKIFLIPEVKVIYYARESISKAMKMFFQYGLYKPLVNVKVGKPATVRQFAPLFLVLYLLSLSPVFFLQNPFFKLYLLPLALYGVLEIIFTVKLAVKGKDPALFFLLPFTFLGIHLSYGIGYLMGIFRFVFFRRSGAGDLGVNR